MNGKLRIGPIILEATLEHSEKDVLEAASEVVNARMERIEAAIVEAVAKELKLALPWITVESTGIEMREDDPS